MFNVGLGGPKANKDRFVNNKYIHVLLLIVHAKWFIQALGYISSSANSMQSILNWTHNS